MGASLPGWEICGQSEGERDRRNHAGGRLPGDDEQRKGHTEPVVSWSSHGLTQELTIWKQAFLPSGRSSCWTGQPKRPTHSWPTFREMAQLPWLGHLHKAKVEERRSGGELGNGTVPMGQSQGWRLQQQGHGCLSWSWGCSASRLAHGQHPVKPPTGLFYPEVLFCCGTEMLQAGLASVQAKSQKLHAPVLLILEVPAPFRDPASRSESCNHLTAPRNINTRAHSSQETSREAYTDTGQSCSGGRRSCRDPQSAERRWDGRLQRAEDPCRNASPAGELSVSRTTLPPMWKSAIKRSNYPKSQPPSDK